MPHTHRAALHRSLLLYSAYTLPFDIFIALCLRARAHFAALAATRYNNSPRRAALCAASWQLST